MSVYPSLAAPVACQPPTFASSSIELHCDSSMEWQTLQLANKWPSSSAVTQHCILHTSNTLHSASFHPHLRRIFIRLFSSLQLPISIRSQAQLLSISVLRHPILAEVEGATSGTERG